MRPSILLVAMLVWGVANRSAHADGVGVVVTGDSAIQPQLAAQIEDWLRQRGHTLVAAPLRPDALGTLIDCLAIEDVACARKIVESEAQTERIMFAKADLVATGAVRDITLTAYWFAKGSEPTAARRTCAACTDTTIHTTIDDIMTTLAGQGRADVGTVQVTTTPAGARLRVDGKDATSGVSLPVGEHVVEVSHPGYVSVRESVTIKGGDTVTLTFALHPEKPRNKLALAGIGAGVVLAGVGIVLVATSEEDTGEKPEYRDTRAGGYVLTGLGVAAIAVSTWWYLRGGSAESSPSVAVIPGGATLGWARTF